MKWLALTFLLLTLIPTTYAQTIHAFLICNTFDKDIGNGVKVNKQLMQGLDSNLAEGTNYPLVEHDLSGSHFTYKELTSQINTVLPTLTQADIVILFFSCHGFRFAADSDRFPRCAISDQLVPTWDIAKRFSDKKPRCLLTIVDACNELVTPSPQDSFQLATATVETIKQIKDINISKIKNLNYLTLFNNCYSLILAAGPPGQDTYMTPQGSYFFLSFIEAFNEAIRQQSDWLSWSKIIHTTKSYTTAKLAGIANYTPIWYDSSCARYHPSYDTNSQNLKPGSVQQMNGYGIDLYTNWVPRHSTHGRDTIRVYATFRTDEPVDSLVYYLGYTMNPSTLKLRAIDSVNELYENTVLDATHFDHPALRGQNFTIRFFTADTFNVKAKAYFKNGLTREYYIAIHPPSKDRKDKSLIKELIVLSAIILFYLFVSYWVRRLLLKSKLIVFIVICVPYLLFTNLLFNFIIYFQKDLGLQSLHLEFGRAKSYLLAVYITCFLIGFSNVASAIVVRHKRKQRPT